MTRMPIYTANAQCSPAQQGKTVASSIAHSVTKHLSGIDWQSGCQAIPQVWQATQRFMTPNQDKPGEELQVNFFVRAALLSYCILSTVKRVCNCSFYHRQGCIVLIAKQCIHWHAMTMSRRGHIK